MTQELEPGTPNYIHEIEGVISTMIAEGQTVQAGYDSQEGYLWKFQYGSVEVYVQLTGQTDDDSLTVWSYVLSLPAKEEAQLMRKLLEMNWLKTFEAHFAIVDNRVVVVATRTVAELSPGEIARAITLVANIADDNDDALIAEFGQ
ncbi:MAG: YbjN domain-containing protein [Roseofilum sp. SBFL]|nr:YbjN domain-containing protein [Roseofilum sp. SID3]MBP0023057.1 YbjN domain-containing protein [Roseofilum sp. SID2]MBP0039083.1 YbjN domain-containing protein [Roseofilum sp. SID1]MBP0041240.1 YbjN domain-containing protein [Roseofilum sp. SBFL]